MEGCPQTEKILCGHTTISRGLCVKDIAECNIRSNGPRPIPVIPENEVGKKYAYVEEFLGQHCFYPHNKLKVDYEAVYEGRGELIPDVFTFLTYNIWGLAQSKNHQHLFNLRKNLLEETLRAAKADILCLQEMSVYAYKQLEPFILKYKFASEIPYPASSSKRNREVDTYIISNYHPERIVVYGLPGVLGYEDSVTIVEYPNLVIFNLYNQAGSKHSPGQQHKWIHYSRCRYDILESIYLLILKKYSHQNIILCGDFNFDLDGSIEEWPEIEMMNSLKRIGFIDSYRSVHPDNPGYTEDTDKNFMRFNQKLIEKRYRYDAVLYRLAPPGPIASWGIRAAELVGTDMECLDAEESDWFIQNMSEAKGGREHLLRRCTKDGHLPIFPSDHFGVLTHFQRNKQIAGRRRRTRMNKRKTKRNFTQKRCSHCK